MPGSQPLTVFPLLTSGGNLTNTTIQTYLRQGQIGELANTYMVNKWNGPVNFYTNPNVQGANVIVERRHVHLPCAAARSHQADALRAPGAIQLYLRKIAFQHCGRWQTNFEPLLDNNNPSLEYARSPYDIRHAFKANYYYELPFGKGKRWSGNAI